MTNRQPPCDSFKRKTQQREHERHPLEVVCRVSETQLQVDGNSTNNLAVKGRFKGRVSHLSIRIYNIKMTI